MAPTARGPRPHEPTDRSYFDWTVDDLPGASAETTSQGASLGDAHAASTPHEGVRTAA